MKEKKHNLILIWIISFLIFYFLISQFRYQGPVAIESPDKIVMDTIAKVIAVAPDKKTAQSSINAALEKISHLEKLMNRYDPNSELSKVNLLADSQPVKVDKDLFEILQQSVIYSEQTEGAFDITVGALVDLWRRCAETNSLPSASQLAETKKSVGYEKIILDANSSTVRFTTKGVSLDLGAIAKGFAADKAIAEMKRCGAVGGLIDIGGQIGCFGTTNNKDKWTIGIRNPAKSESESVIAKLTITDMAVSTSGDYERFYKIGNQQFSHILNPKTKKNADELASVTIISPSGTLADALATAVNVLGADKGIEIIEKINDTEAILIKHNSSELIKSSGVERYLVK